MSGMTIEALTALTAAMVPPIINIRFQLHRSEAQGTSTALISAIVGTPEVLADNASVRRVSGTAAATASLVAALVKA